MRQFPAEETAIDRYMDLLAQAGRAMQLLAKTLEEQPEALIRGKREENP